MADLSPNSIACSGCGGTSFTADSAGEPICDYCGAVCAPSDLACHRCGAAYAPGAERCPSCGAVLVRECPRCGVRNPLMARRCVVCGQTLDASEAMFARLTTKTADQLRRVRATGVEIKSKEDQASKARLAEMWAREDRWREEQAAARARRAQRERLIIALAIGLALVVTVAVVIAVIAARSGLFAVALGVGG